MTKLLMTCSFIVIALLLVIAVELGMIYKAVTPKYGHDVSIRVGPGEAIPTFIRDDSQPIRVRVVNSYE